MRGLGILILIVLFFWLVWPSVSRWLKRKAIQKAESYMRSKMGMPPPPPRNEDYGRSQTRRNYRRYSSEPLIPKEYAEDVEFTETKDFSRYESISNTKSAQEKYHESQISDAEWTEVKSSGSK